MTSDNRRHDERHRHGIRAADPIRAAPIVYQRRRRLSAAAVPPRASSSRSLERAGGRNIVVTD